MEEILGVCSEFGMRTLDVKVIRSEHAELIELINSSIRTKSNISRVDVIEKGKPATYIRDVISRKFIKSR